MLLVYNLKKISQSDFPKRTDSSELLHTAEDSFITADIPRPTNKQQL
jgi:hypothetical protein